jgi:hypothetical protein
MVHVAIAVVDEAPSVIHSMLSPAAMTFAPVGVAKVKTEPAAEPEFAAVPSCR